jgi:hypothetical protein
MGTTTPQIQDNRYTLVANFASTAAVSSHIDLAGYRLASIDMSTAWTTSSLGITFAVGNDTTSLLSLWDEGVEVSLPSAAANRSIVPSTGIALALAGHRYVQLQSGASSGMTGQAAARVLNLTLVPF